MTFNPIQMESCICFQISARRLFSNRPEPEPVTDQLIPWKDTKLCYFIPYHIIRIRFKIWFRNHHQIIWIRLTYFKFDNIGSQIRAEVCISLKGIFLLFKIKFERLIHAAIQIYVTSYWCFWFHDEFAMCVSWPFC